MRNLILFTSYFPFKKGDYVFIKNEIYDLATYFDKIFIFPLESGEMVLDSSFLPNNVFPFPGLLSNQNRKKLLIDSLKSKLPMRETCKLFFSELKQIKTLGHFKNLLFSLLIIRAQHTNIVNFLKYHTDINSSNTCCYYFWGTGLSYILASSQNLLHLFPSLIRFHGGDLYEERHNGYIPFRRNILNNATVLTSVSQLGTQYLNRQLAKYDIKKTANVLRLGTIDYAMFENINPTPNLITHNKKVPNDTFVVVSCSRVIPLKRVDLIYRALNIAANSKLPIKWIHFGDGTALVELKNITNQRNIHLNIVLYGNAEHSDIIQFYKDNYVDFFMNASTTEGIPVSIMEAISFNIPILASDAGGTSELVSEANRTGRIFPVDITDYELSKIIKQFCEELKPLQSKYAPRAFWEKNYNQKIANQNLINKLNLLF